MDVESNGKSFLGNGGFCTPKQITNKLWKQNQLFFVKANVYTFRKTCLWGGGIWDQSSNSLSSSTGIFLFVDVVGNATTREKETAYRLAFYGDNSTHVSQRDSMFWRKNLRIPGISWRKNTRCWSCFNF